MSISSGGLVSGLDTQSIIDSLIQIAARPRQLAEQRLVQLQFLQTAYLDVNSSLMSLSSASSAFRNNDTFNTRAVASSNEDALTASAAAGAPEGTFRFLVDRLVSTQQLLGRGFSSLDDSSIGASNISFDSAQASLSRETLLSDLNDGEGITRGIITISDGSNSAEVDLSSAATVDEVLDAINAEGSINVTARVEDGSFVLEGATSVTSAPGRTTVEDLGLAGIAASGGAITGTRVYGINRGTSLSSLNDGRGVDYDNLLVSENRNDFQIVVDDGGALTTVRVNLGDIYELDTEDEDVDGDPAGGFNKLAGPVTTVGGVLDRINDALDDAGYGDVTASLDPETGGFVLDGSGAGVSLTVEENPTGGRTTAAELGLLGSGATVNGSRVLAGINTTLTASLNGGTGVGGDGTITVTDRNGVSTTVTGLDGAETTAQLLRSINDQLADAGVGVAFAQSSSGIGLTATDTSGGTGNLIIEGTGGDDTAESLGLSTGAAGVASNTVGGGNLQLGYVGLGTLLSDLRDGQGIDTGTFTITDSLGNSADIQIDSGMRTLGEVVDRINGRDIAVTARINDTGDGIVIEETPGTNGSQAISITDDSGTAAADLGIAGTAEGTGADNTIDGSFERVVEIDPSDTLQDVVQKINEAGAGVDASVINTGSGSAPYRLSLVSESSGSAGRFVIDTNGFDFGLTTLNAGDDARLFYGSSDPADGVLVTSSSNAFDDVVTGLSIQARATTAEAVELSVTQDTDKIEEDVKAFISAFNAVISRIDSQSRYVEETNTRGPLLGDGTTQRLRNTLFTTVQGPALNVSSGNYNRLVDVGVTVGDGGKLELDADRLRTALADDPEAVKALFAERELVAQDEFVPVDGVEGASIRRVFTGDEFSSLGIAGLVEQLGKRYTDSVDGILTARRDSLDTQILGQENRIDRLTEQLEARRERLEAQYVAMERAIAGLQGAQSALSSLG